MQYSIWIVNSWPDVQGPRAKGHTRCFEEVALALQSAFRELGYDVPVVDRLEKATGRVIILGAGVLDRYKNLTLPEDAIIYNFEQVHERARFFLPGHPYITFLRRHAVWDYSQGNITELRQRGVQDITMCGVGYMPELTRIPKQDDEDIDVLFIGSMHERRENILNALKQQGLNVQIIQNMYGKARDAMIARSKVIVNIHLQPANIFEVVRVSYLLANRKCVVSEEGDDKALEGPYEKAVVFRPYEELVNACLDYVADHVKRKAQEEAAFAMFSQLSQMALLQPALKAMENSGQAGNVKSMMSDKAPAIFVNIASYRDPETDATIRDLFRQARHPDRIHVGVCLQIDARKDKMCSINTDRPWQVRIRQYTPEESKGANWARAQAQHLWEGEEYVLQIDSHMRFASDWDVAMIDMLEACPSDKPLLSTYVPRYTPPDNRLRLKDGLLRIRVHEFEHGDRPQLLHLTKIPVPFSDKERTGLYPSPFYIANFMFCHGKMLQDVPFDPYIRFWGDEITYSARLWTHGYDVFQPDRTVLWHYWRRDELVGIQPYRRAADIHSKRSAARIKHLLGIEMSDDTVALTDFEKYSLGKERDLSSLWAFAGINWDTHAITDEAKKGWWNMAARKQAKTTKKAAVKKAAPKAKGKTKGSGLPRIFVQIPSYRDPDCQHTVKDLFEKAAHPERITVGICWQFIKGEDDDCFEIPYPYPDQVRVHEIHAPDSKGMCWARHITQTMWQGEEFTLSMDAHMRFDPGWDDILIGMWEECENPKSVLTVYPPIFKHPDERQSGSVHGMSAVKFDKHGILTLLGKPAYGLANNAPKLPIPGALIGDGTLFGPASIIKDVPFDPHLYFYGQEISVAVRLWTHGYDIRHPHKNCIYHDYDRPNRKFHSTDNPKDGQARNLRAFARVRHIFGMEECKDPEVIKEIDKYGLGKVRSLEDYQRFSGIRFAKRKMLQYAHDGLFPNHYRFDLSEIAKKKRANATGMPRIFVQIGSYRNADCLNTVRDLFAKATHPERIRVGICWNFQRNREARPSEMDYPYPDQVTVYEFDAYNDPKNPRGICWIRSMAQQTWCTEEFTLSVSSHSRFEQGWDKLVLDMWRECANPMAVLSAFPARFDLPDTLHSEEAKGIIAAGFDENGLLTTRADSSHHQGSSPGKPVPGAFVSDLFLFAPSSVVDDVPMDPHMFFTQDVTLSARLWTSGYDIYHPGRPVIYNDYAFSELELYQQDNAAHMEPCTKKAHARIKHLLGTEACADPEMVSDLEVYGLGNARTLKAYEDYSGVDFAQKIVIRKAEHKNTLHEQTGITVPDEASLPLHRRPFHMTKPGAIFVNIASYRDPECQWTVKDLFEKANNPERVYVGICWQFDEAEDVDCFQVVTRPDQVRIHPVNWRDAEGVCWARYQTQQLWDGEEYNLMIDSHMRFVPGWDDLMIKELAACDAPKPFLSCSPASYQPPDRLSKNMNASIRRVKPFLPDGNIRCQGEALDRRPDNPLNAAFMVANFAFSRSEVLHEVPYDPYLYFDQEEITYAARLYTHGWDIFSARQQFLYHYYNDAKAPGGSVRKLHWRDLREENKQRIHFLRDRGLKRFNHLTGHKLTTDPEIITQLDEFGWGKARSLEEFEAYSGVDFKNKITSEKALRCWFIRDLAKYRIRPIFVPELDNQNRIAAQAGGQQAAVGGIAQGAKNVQHTGLKGPPSGQFQPQNFQGAQPAGRPPVTLVSLQADQRTQDNKPEQQQAQNAKKPAPDYSKPVPVIIKNAPRTLLDVGDFMPMFSVTDHKEKRFNIEFYGGKHAIIFFLPGDVQFLETFFRSLQQKVDALQLKHVWKLFVVDAPAARLNEIREQLKLQQTLCSGNERKIAHSLGICQSVTEKLTPTGFVLSPNLKITARYREQDPVALAALMVQHCYESQALFEQKHAQPRVFSEIAPALIVPDAFTQEFCDKCIHSFRMGHNFKGTVGGGASKGYRPEIKLRQDHVPPPALTAEIDDKLSRTLFPEIEKIFGMKVKFRERYKVGLYNGDGDEKGFFLAHRDNFDAPLGYRRLAMTLHLTDGFEGGGLRFPEYGNDIYKPARGSAITFSCSTLHEALPVTKGERFILVGFFHGEEQERYRRYYAMKHEAPINPREFVPTLRHYPELTLNRQFYQKWMEECMDYDRVSQQPSARAGASSGADTSDSPVSYVKTPVAGLGAHKPIKVFESQAALVVDNFLPEDQYQKLLHYVQRLDYEQINMSKTGRAWHVQDGFPLRSSEVVKYYPNSSPPRDDITYPTGTVLDMFVEHMVAAHVNARHMCGEADKDWECFSIGAWLYPHGTGRALHDDSAGVYSGAYVYFLNPVWMPHWGGQLLLMDSRSNEEPRNPQENKADMYKGAHMNAPDEIMMEEGLAQCIFPKRNRMVYIAPGAHHMVTRVNEQCGDNIHMSLAGFFVKKKKTQ